MPITKKGIAMKEQILTNYAEEFVREYVDEHISEYDVCQCEDCKLDIMALMLNKLPTCYVVTEKGAMLTHRNQVAAQYSANVALAWTDAIEIVKKRPRHN